jgi:Ni/Fe-hydrogenase subunit HybB-like protein
MRWDVNLSTQLLRVGWMPGEPFGGFATYTPTWVEWATAAAIVAYWLLGFTLSMHLFPVFGQDDHHGATRVHGNPATTETQPSVEAS